MNTSIVIAKLMGPVMLVAGLSMLLNRKSLDVVFKDFLGSPGLIYVAGVLALVMGLAIVIFHNVWVPGWPVIITIFGWISVCAGILRMGFPGAVKSMGRAMIASRAMITFAAVFNAALGGFLTYKGYLA